MDTNMRTHRYSQTKSEVVVGIAVISDKQLMTSDGIHPNPDGARKLAEVVAKAILPNQPR